MLFQSLVKKQHVYNSCILCMYFSFMILVAYSIYFELSYQLSFQKMYVYFSCSILCYINIIIMYTVWDITKLYNIITYNKMKTSAKVSRVITTKPITTPITVPVITPSFEVLIVMMVCTSVTVKPALA